jgi:hypothetical protein
MPSHGAISSPLDASFQLGRRPSTNSAGSISSAQATRTIVSSVGKPFPSSRWLMSVRWRQRDQRADLLAV